MKAQGGKFMNALKFEDILRRKWKKPVIRSIIKAGQSFKI